MSVCLHPRCQAPTPSDQVACRPHWFQLPKPLRARIWSAWRKRNSSAFKRHHGEAAAAHRATLVEAIEFWKLNT